MSNRAVSQKTIRNPRKVGTIPTVDDAGLIREINARLSESPDDILWIAHALRQRWPKRLPKKHWTEYGFRLNYWDAQYIYRIPDHPAFLKHLHCLPSGRSHIIAAFKCFHKNPMAFLRAVKNGTLDKHVSVIVIRQIKNHGKPLAQLRQEKREAALADPTFKSGFDVYAADFHVLWERLEDNSIDLIFTDPPWNNPHLFGETAKLAAAKLKPGKFCLLYFGKYWLPEVVTAMWAHLQYRWLFTIRFSERQPPRRDLNVGITNHHLLLFQKPPIGRMLNMMPEEIVGYMDKDFHEWGQGLDEARQFIRTLTDPGDLVVDPFGGGGTVSVASRVEVRRCITTEIDPEKAAAIRKRLAEHP